MDSAVVDETGVRVLSRVDTAVAVCAVAVLWAATVPVGVRLGDGAAVEVCVGGGVAVNVAVLVAVGLGEERTIVGTELGGITGVGDLTGTGVDVAVAAGGLAVRLAVADSVGDGIAVATGVIVGALVTVNAGAAAFAGGGTYGAEMGGSAGISSDAGATNSAAMRCSRPGLIPGVWVLSGA